MKLLKTLVLLIVISTIISCKKTKTPGSTIENYSSVADFLAQNSATVQTYVINANSGGSFTTPQGTLVTIPANAFEHQGGGTVTGNVAIKFKDIYKKSEMLLSDKPTMTYYGPLKSGGEFFLKAISNNAALNLAPGKKIVVAQPAALTGGLDTVNIQEPFVLGVDSIGGNSWVSNPADSVFYSASSYIFNMYQFSTPVDMGTWCNSDNSSFFAAYPQTVLTLHSTNTNVSSSQTDVFLVFNNISSMVHVYGYNYNFPYQYAPQGLQCTVVALGVKDGTLYSSFVPITIGANQTVNFTLSATTGSQFITQLTALD